MEVYNYSMIITQNAADRTREIKRQLRELQHVVRKVTTNECPGRDASELCRWVTFVYADPEPRFTGMHTAIYSRLVENNPDAKVDILETGLYSVTISEPWPKSK